MNLYDFTKHFLHVVFDRPKNASLYTFETGFLRLLQNNNKTYVIKSRLMHVTTMYQAYILWRCLFTNKPTNFIVFTPVANYYLRRINKVCDSLDVPVRLNTNNRHRLDIFDNSIIMHKGSNHPSTTLIGFSDVEIIIDDYDTGIPDIELLNDIINICHDCKISMSKTLTQYKDLDIESTISTIENDLGFVGGTLHYKDNPLWTDKRLESVKMHNIVEWVMSMECRLPDKSESTFNTYDYFGYDELREYNKLMPKIKEILNKQIYEDLHTE